MRILFLTEHLPSPIDRAGGGIRTRLLLDALARTGRVDLLLLNGNFTPGQIDAIDADAVGGLEDVSLLGVIPVGGPRLSPSAYKRFRLRRILRTASGFGTGRTGLAVDRGAKRRVAALLSERSYDLIVSRYMRPLARVDGLRLPLPPLIVDADDYDVRTARTQLSAMPPGRLLHRYMARQRLAGFRDWNAAVTRQAAHVWYASTEDVAAVGRDNVSTLPNLPLDDALGPITPASPSAAGGDVLLAVAAWKYWPNRDSMDWFLTHCWPRVRERRPATRLAVVGSVTDEARTRWAASPGVDVRGFVDSLADAYESASAVVAPVTWGGGTKIKVLEALAYGRAMVATRHAVGGLSGPGIDDVIGVGDEPSAFADRCVELLNDDERRGRLERLGRDFFETHCSYDGFRSAVADRVLAAVNGEPSKR